MHKPGIPADLLPPERLWERWGLAAVVGADAKEEGERFRFGVWAETDADEPRLRYDDGGCSGWWFLDCGSGRFVLFGHDDASRLSRYTEPSVDQEGPPLDRFAGAPGWLPAEVSREVENMPDACVYWCEEGTWARAPYPEELADDGIATGLRWLHDREKFLGELGTWDGQPLGVALPEPRAEGLLDAAERRRVTPELLESAAAETEAELAAEAEDEYATLDDVRPLDLPAALRALEATGLGGGL